MAMGADLAECPCGHVLDYIARMDGYADQMRRFRGDVVTEKRND